MKTLYPIACRTVLFLMCNLALMLSAQDVEFLSSEVASPEDAEVEILETNQENITAIEKATEQATAAETAEKTEAAEPAKPAEASEKPAEPAKTEEAAQPAEKNEAAPAPSSETEPNKAEKNTDIEIKTENAPQDADADAESEEGEPLANVQAYWDLCEISNSYRASFADDQDWSESNELLYIQYKLNQLPLEMLEAWCRPQNELKQVDTWTHEQLNQNRFEAFRVDGILQSIKAIDVPEEVVSRYQLKRYYECTLLLKNGRKVVVFCRTIPRKFQNGDFGKNEKVGADAILLKRGPMPPEAANVAPEAGKETSAEKPAEAKPETTPDVTSSSTTDTTTDAAAADAAPAAEPANAAEEVPVEKPAEAAPEAAEAEKATTAEATAETTEKTDEATDETDAEDEEVKPRPTLYLFSQRLSWYPEGKTLCEFGFDYSLFDDLDRTEQGEDATRSKGSDLRLTQRNRECFYQMIHKVGRIQAPEWKKLVKDLRKNTPKERLEKDTTYSSALPLFKKPIDERGNLFLLRGTARQIVPIEVQDKDIVKRFGITRYYEIFMYTEEAPQAPIAVLVRKLPKDIQPGDAPGYRVELEVPAFFFNTWGYHSMDRAGKPVIRLMPLLMGGTPQTVVNSKPISLFWFHVIATVVFASFGLLLLVSYITFTRSDRQFWLKGTIGRQLRPDNPGLEAENLQDIEQPEPETDFTKWNDADFSVDALLPEDREIPGVIRPEKKDKKDKQDKDGK